MRLSRLAICTYLQLSDDGLAGKASITRQPLIGGLCHGLHQLLQPLAPGLSHEPIMASAVALCDSQK